MLPPRLPILSTGSPAPRDSRAPRRVRGRGMAGLLLLVAFLALAACTADESDYVGFETAVTTNDDFTQVSVPVGDSPVHATAVDLDGDGDTDVVTVNLWGHSVSVVTNLGGGAFASTTLGLPDRANQVVAGDLDGGGPTNLDLVVTLFDTAALVVLFNDGTTWTSQQITLADSAGAIAVVDLDGAGVETDILAAATGGSILTALRNDGSGSFTATETETCAGGQFFTTGDYDGDGKLDDVAMVCTGENLVHILLGDGNGGFTKSPATGITVGDQPKFILPFDFNGDTQMDLAVTNYADDTVSILQGNSFAVVATLPVGELPERMAAGNFYNSNPSLAVAQRDEELISLLLGDGAGGFTVLQQGVSEDPFAVATEDFTGDGIIDVLSLEKTDRIMSILAGDNAGGFTRSVIGFDELPTVPIVGDFDGTGTAKDVMVLIPSLDQVRFLLNVN